MSFALDFAPPDMLPSKLVLVQRELAYSHASGPVRGNASANTLGSLIAIFGYTVLLKAWPETMTRQ